MFLWLDFAGSQICIGVYEHFRPEPRILTKSMAIGYFQDAVSAIPSLYTGRRQLSTAANSQYGGRRSRYKIIFAFHAIIKYPLPVLWVCIHRNSMYAFIEHCHLNYMSRLLLLDGGKETAG